MTEITIKVGNTNVQTTSEDLVEVNETPDGVVFGLKGGLSVLFTNPYMPSSAKQIVKNTADHIKGKKLIFELDNPQTPAKVVS
jgi:hypothetical protein